MTDLLTGTFIEQLRAQRLERERALAAMDFSEIEARVIAHANIDVSSMERGNRIHELYAMYHAERFDYPILGEDHDHT